MVILLAALSMALLAMTLLPLLRSERWWIRALEFPRLQLCALAVGMLALEGIILDFSKAEAWLFCSIATACLLWQLWWIAPYSPLHGTEVHSATHVDGSRRIRLLSANVLGTNRQADRFLGLVDKHSPDIVLTLESNSWWQSRLDVLESDYPYTMKCPLENLYGMHVYSRLPLEQTRIEYLVNKEVPSMHAAVRLRSGDCIRVRFVHPAPPSPNESTDTTERDAELLVIARNHDREGVPTIVAGDLNDVAWSRTTRLFRKISGMLDPRIGRGMFNTFHAAHWFLRWPLDHLFHGPQFSLCHLERLEPFGSDHFALLSELQYEPANSKSGTNSLSRDDSDEAESRRKIDQGKVDGSDVPDPDGG
ncbi:endonuclease/exonuclease/phosphatase family protein [Dokdonella sp.]|uniref:endonuclease/exonuclease/phosphatase family protein n=1 Tax=Dokdonella sp. TaxID=2291710 RepID=UPI003527A02E